MRCENSFFSLKTNDERLREARVKEARQRETSCGMFILRMETVSSCSYVPRDRWVADDGFRVSGVRCRDETLCNTINIKHLTLNIRHSLFIIPHLSPRLI
jgi:hypothetical protein